MNIVKVYITKIERQLERKVKIIKLDRGGEYYGKYGESWQCPNPFAKLLKKCSICTQCTMLWTSQQNHVAERCNRTLMDMVKSMLSNSILPLSLWMYAIKIVE